MPPKTANLAPKVPDHNPACEGCLQRGLTVNALVEAVEQFITASKEKDKKLDELILEVRIANQVKEVQDKILIALFGDGTEENIGLIRKQDQIYNALFVGSNTPDDPGLVLMVHNDHTYIQMIRGIFIGGKWLWGCLGTAIVATFVAMAIHLARSGDLNVIKLLGVSVQ